MESSCFILLELPATWNWRTTELLCRKTRGKALRSSTGSNDPISQHSEMVRRNGRWSCYSSSPTEQGHFYHQWMHPAQSLHPDGSRIWFLTLWDNMTSGDLFVGWLVPSTDWIAGKDLYCSNKPFFPQKTGSGLRAKAILHQLHCWETESHWLLVVATFPPSPEWRQTNTPMKCIKILVYFTCV